LHFFTEWNIKIKFSSLLGFSASTNFLNYDIVKVCISILNWNMEIYLIKRPLTAVMKNIKRKCSHTFVKVCKLIWQPLLKNQKRKRSFISFAKVCKLIC
jgi:hypothetical protein